MVDYVRHDMNVKTVNSEMTYVIDQLNKRAYCADPA